MKKVLAIVASPRKLGNCEIMAKEIIRQIPEPCESKFMRLPEFDIRPCVGCYTCLAKGKCVIEDDFDAASQAIVWADALIVCAPTYFLGPNACLKRFIDRGIALYSHAEVLWGKPAVGVGIAGIPGKEGYTLLGVESFLKLLMAEVKDCRMVYGALPGETLLNPENKKTAAELAGALLSAGKEPRKPCCPLCGGQTFRFLGNNEIRCMLCSNTGTFSAEKGVIVFDVRKGEHEFFLTRQDALEHREWLIGMKARFMELKDDLKKISMEYRKEGEWIVPKTRNSEIAPERSPKA